MNNAISTSSALEGVDKQQLSARIIKNSAQLLEDYVLWHKCGWSDDEFGQLIGISAKTVKNRYLADARKQGLIEASKMSRPNCARNRAQIVENSTPPSESQSSTAVDADILPPLLEYNDSSSTESGTVSVLPNDREPDFPDLESQRDYEFALDLIQQLKDVMSKHRHGYDRWAEFYWLSLKQEISVAHSFAANKSSRADASIRRNCDEAVKWAVDAIRQADEQMGS